MRTWTYAAAAVAALLAITTWSAPSQADMWNGPIQQNGKCWHGSFPQGIGYWGECAKPAAATVPNRPTTRRHHS